jgi:hypothetical protein
MSIANDIAMALHARLSEITTANGFETNAGSRVLRGRRRLDQSKLPCCVIIELPDSVKDQQTRRVSITAPYVLEAHAQCDPDNPNDVGHKLVADIKRAVFSAPLKYGDDKPLLALKYVRRTIAPRDDGTDVVAVAVEVSAEYVEQLANP